MNVCDARDTSGLKHATFDIALQVEEPHQRIWFGDPQVIARQNSEPSAPLEKVTKVLEHTIDAALERKAHDDVGSIRSCQLRNDMRQEWIVATRYQIACAVAFSR